MRPRPINLLAVLLVIFLFLGCQTNSSLQVIDLDGFQPASFGEQTLSYTVDPEIKVSINAPATFNPNHKLKLIFYTLPNGNSTAETIGKKITPAENIRFDIQHIAAQTRFLRAHFTDTSIVVVYLEADQKSWPAWRKKHADHPELIPQLVSSIKEKFKGFDVLVTLSGHSGGGSFIFGYINAVTTIPNDIERIAFLDSNYAYDAKLGHTDKLLQWLRASPKHYLSVLAYNDAIALLNGKSFISAEGGTWGRSHAMLQDFSALNFTRQTNGEMETDTALNGQVKFWLRENPERKIYHTVQVERNGFIQSICSGTVHEGVDYTYFGDRAYSKWIAPE